MCYRSLYTESQRKEVSSSFRRKNQALRGAGQSAEISIDTAVSFD